MKKALILLLGAMLAMVALQGCSSDKSDTPSPTVIDDNVDQPVVPTDAGQIVLAKIEVGLGGGAGDDTVIGRIHQPVDLIGGGGGSMPPYTPTDFIGLGWADVNITGEGLTAAYPCAYPSVPDGTCTACPNSLDPLTGLPLSPDPCAGTRGTFTGTAITAALTVTNNTAASGLGTCDSSALVTPLYNDAGTTCRTLDAFDNAKPVPDIDCRPNTVGGGNYCMGNLVYAGSGQGSGYCGDGVTACVEANSGATGASFDCGAATCISDGISPCFVDADCPGALAGDCPLPGAPIGDTKCWTGCGVCVPGRDLQCVAIQYTGSQAQGTATDLDALGNVKCSGGPYAPTQAGINAVENPAPGTADAWFLGNPGIAQGGSASETISIDSLNNSYCVHTILVLEDPRGNNGHIDGVTLTPECVAQCGDHFIAELNGEVCEPVYTMADPYAHLGCTGQYYCSNDQVAPFTACVPGVLFDPLVACGDATATCGSVCEPTACGACMPPAPSTCGNGLLDAGEDCDLGIDPTCCTALCTFAGAGSDPNGDCLAGDQCNSDTCNGAGACTGAVPVADGTACGSAVNTDCDNPDTCSAGVCVSNLEAGGFVCGTGLTEPTCNPAACDGAGTCVDGAVIADNTPCADNGGDTCCTNTCQAVGGVCPGGAPVATPTARQGTSPGYADDFNNGQTSGQAGIVYTILPNDPAAAVHGQDMVVFDIAIAPALIAGDTVACTVGGIPASNNCGVGDAACIGWGVHPEITAGGIDTTNQQCVAAGSPGIGPSVAPDEADTDTAVAITCTTNGGQNPTTQNITLRLGFIGIRDQVVGAAPATVSPEAFVYCSSGSDGAGGVEYCEGTGTGAPKTAQRGIATYNDYTFYDSAVFSGVAGGTKPPANGRTSGPYWHPDPATCPTCVFVDSFSCSNVAAGVYVQVGYTIPCNGAILLDNGSCTLNVTAPPASGVTGIDVSALNTAFTAFANSVNGWVIRGIDNDLFTALPSSNVTGYMIFQ